MFWIMRVGEIYDMEDEVTLRKSREKGLRERECNDKKSIGKISGLARFPVA